MVIVVNSNEWSMCGIGGNCVFVSSTKAWDEKYVFKFFAFFEITLCIDGIMVKSLYTGWDPSWI